MDELNDLTDLEQALADAEMVAPTYAGEPTERKCRRHRWVPEYGVMNGLDGYTCKVCGRPRDFERSRRGKNARSRGNALQLKAARSAGIANIGALGLPEDAGTSRDWLVLQVKSGAGYPKNLDRWLRALTTTADQLRGVVYVETPGAGRKAKRLIVLDYDEFLQWFGPNKRAA